jgi:hypothetical protein
MFGNYRYFRIYAAVQVNEGKVLCLLHGMLKGDANVMELDITSRISCWSIQHKENERPPI